jgi:hypothetical protein
MRRQYLHLSAYCCDNCTGPVIAGWLAVRENEISKETDIRQVGALCLSCGHRQSKATEPARARNLSAGGMGASEPDTPGRLTTAYVEALNRAELR